jgi:hypothetical protein
MLVDWPSAGLILLIVTLPSWSLQHRSCAVHLPAAAYWLSLPPYPDLQSHFLTFVEAKDWPLAQIKEEAPPVKAAPPGTLRPTAAINDGYPCFRQTVGSKKLPEMRASGFRQSAEHR